MTGKPKAQKKDVNPARARFARALVQKRKERGFKTAYAFFHKTGGQKNFRFSYYYYLLIERGLRLPSEKALQTVLDSLAAHATHFESRKELLTLYVRALVGGSAFFDPVFEATPASPSEKSPDYAVAPGEKVSDSPDDEILRIATRRNVRNVPRMSQEQVDAVMSSSACFWVYQWLTQTGRKSTAADLGRELRLRPDEVTPALNQLLARKLIEKGPNATFFSPHFETDLFEPMANMGPDKLFWFSTRMHERLKAETQGHFYSFFLMGIEDQQRMSTIMNLFREAMRKIYILRPDAPVKQGTLVAVETRVAPMLPIEKA